jgi:hypothetical protein
VVPKFLTAPTPVVRAELILVALTKILDGATTVLVVANPQAVESVPFTRFLIGSVGTVPGVAAATAFGIAAVVAVGEFGHRFCALVRSVLSIESAPYPCVPQHVTYVLSSSIFAAAAVWNLSLVV